jgi:hypothetical protein
MSKYAFLSVFVLTGVMMAADHPALGGAWVLDSAHSEMDATKIKSETLSINQQDETIQLNETVTAANGKETTSAISCNTAGQTCKIKDHGQAEVSFWYNRDALVMSEMRHGEDWVVKRRLKPSADGHTLAMEVIHLAPPLKTETLTFTRSQPTK